MTSQLHAEVLEVDKAYWPFPTGDSYSDRTMEPAKQSAPDFAASQPQQLRQV